MAGDGETDTYVWEYGKSLLKIIAYSNLEGRLYTSNDFYLDVEMLHSPSVCYLLLAAVHKVSILQRRNELREE